MSPYTVRCYQCGQRIPEEQASRHKVRVGEGVGLTGGLFDVSSWFAGALWRLEDLCPDCVAERQQRRQELDQLLRRLGLWLMFLAVLGGIILILLLRH